MRVVVACHPDDELLYFLPVLRDAHLIVVTDGDHAGKGKDRREVLDKVSRRMDAASLTLLMLPDNPAGLSTPHVARLREHLRKVLPQAEEVYTHGPMGEYGHSQHAHVGHVVAECATSPVFVPAYDALASRHVVAENHDYAYAIGKLRHDYGIWHDSPFVYGQFFPYVEMAPWMWNLLGGTDMPYLSWVDSQRVVDRRPEHEGVIREVPFLHSHRHWRLTE